MKALRLGDKGSDVKKWQFFLAGQNYNSVIADGHFGPITEKATKDFQKKNGLTADGIVGTFTYAKAGMMGFELVKNPIDNNKTGIHWPSVPNFKPYSQSQLKQIFGAFNYKVKANGSSITIEGNWETQNLTFINVSLLETLPPYFAKRLRVHKKIAHQFEKMFEDWKKAGVWDRLITYDGGFNPRMIRGTANSLSTHSYGIAIDFNAAWNGLNIIPPQAGKKGSVRELVEIANANGFYWGGHFTSRKDGMHFEVAKII